MAVIDLRSDTLTRPTPGMRQAMAAAEVGDDVYGEDPSVNAFEAKVAAMLGHEAGLLCTTGSLSNLLGVWSLVEPGQEVVCDVRAHIARAEMGAHAALHGITMRTWASADGTADAATIEQIITPDAGPYLVSTAAVALENTHNFAGGTVWELDRLREVNQLCRTAGVKLHLDGARLWNAHIATGVPLVEYGRLFDTVSVCFSKGLGAPLGSMLVSDAETIARARVQRKRLGGGWRQAGILAAAAEYAVDQQLARLADDHAAAGAFAAAVAEKAPQALSVPQTNIVVVECREPAVAVAQAAADRGVALSVVGAHTVRAVTHLGVGLEQAAAAGRVVADLVG